jgi:hypothetical protein
MFHAVKDANPVLSKIVDPCLRMLKLDNNKSNGREQDVISTAQIEEKKILLS